MIFIGIDPGLDGALAFMFTDKDEVRRIETYIMPTQMAGKKRYMDEPTLATMISRWMDHDVFCMVEKVHSMPKQGVSSSFRFGECYGIIRGVLTGLQVPYQLATPQAWQKTMLAGEPKGSEYIVASRMFPKHEFRKSDRARTPHEGLVDAVLIAEYARRTHSGEKE